MDTWYEPSRRRRASAEELAHKAIWSNMLQRCNNPRATGYSNYGGRGVTVCERWDPAKGGSYINFIEDMGYRPSVYHQLDKEAVRTDNLVYGPDTCKWVHRRENLSSGRRRSPKVGDKTPRLRDKPSKVGEKKSTIYWFVPPSERPAHF